MPIFKNQSGQKIPIFAYDSVAGAPKTGDAANITAKVSKDGAAGVATFDLNPTELSATDFPGVYIFDLTQAETNCSMFVLDASSVTSDVSIEPVFIFPTPNFLDDGVSVYDRTTDSLQAQKDAAPSVREITESEIDVILATTIATVTSNTFFTLSDGSPDNDAYNNLKMLIVDRVNPLQKKWVETFDWDPNTKEIILVTDTVPTFVIEPGDFVYILASIERITSLHQNALDQIYGDTRSLYTFWGTGVLTAIQNMFGATPAFAVDSSTFAPTTTQFECNLSGTGDNIYRNQVIRFRTGAHAGLQFRVTASQGTTANPNGKTKLTVSAMPAAPANNDGANVYGQTAGVQTISDVDLLVLQRFVTTNTGQGVASGGSVADLSQGTGGGGGGGGSGATPAEIWSYGIRTLTMTGVQVQSALIDGSNIIIHRGDTIRLSFTGLGDVSDWSKLWFTVKDKHGDPLDSESAVQIKSQLGTAGTGTEGLVYIAGAVASIPANGSITVIDSVEGDIDVELEEDESAKITPSGHYVYDLQMLDSSGVLHTLIEGRCQVIEDVTRATD